MLSLTIAGGIFLLDYKIKEHIDSTRLQGSKEEVLGGRLLLRNCHNTVSYTHLTLPTTPYV